MALLRTRGRTGICLAACFLAAVTACGESSKRAAGPSPSPTRTARVLLFTRTTGFRHDAIPKAVQVLAGALAARGVVADQTEDPATFSDAGLAPYAAVVFLLTTGDVLGDAQQAAFERYVASGRALVGVHSAADTEYAWPFYHSLLGGTFKGHPDGQPAAVIVEDRAHPSTSGLPARWERSDEWYNFASNPRGSVHVLARVDESTYTGGTMGTDHPISWCRESGGGRAWYTGMGHAAEMYDEPLFVGHIVGGVLWAVGFEAGACG